MFNKFKSLVIFCIIFALVISGWYFAELYLFKPLLLALANALFEFVPSLQLSLVAESPSSTSLELTSGAFSPKLNYVVGDYYPGVNLDGVTATKLPTLLSLTIGIPVYTLLEVITRRSKPAPELKVISLNYALVIGAIFIAGMCLVFYKITLISPTGAGMLVQNANGKIISPVSFSPLISAITKVATDFSGIIATFVLPMYLCARPLFRAKSEKIAYTEDTRFK